MRKSKGIIALAAAVTMLLTAIQPVGFAEDATSIVIAGKAATSMEIVYDGASYRNDDAKPYLDWGPNSEMNDTLMRIATPAEEDYTKYSKIEAGYTVEVEEEGVYRLDISGGDVTHLWLSDYGVSMDGGDFKAISASTSTVTDDVVDNSGGESLLKKYETPLCYYLTPGEHDFRVRLLGKAAQKNQYDTFIDVITFTKTDAKEVSDIYIYGMDAHTSSSAELTADRDPNAIANGGCQTGSSIIMRTANNVFAEEGYVVTFPFTVDRAGNYRVTGLGANTQNLAHLSKVALSIDDAPYTNILDMCAASEAYPAEFGAHLSKMQLNKGYALTEGTHYLHIYIYEKREQGNAYAYFDYLKLTREEATDGSFSVYGTDDSTNNFASLPEAWQGITNQYVISGKGTFANVGDHPEYDGKVMSVVASATQEEFPESGIEVDYPFYVEKTGWYQMDVTKNNNGGWFSPLELGVDGALTAFAQGSSAHITAETKLDSNYTNYQTDLQYYLEEGLHTFNFKLTGIAPDRGSTLAFLAEAKFTPVPESELPTSIRINGTAYDSTQLPAGLNPSFNESETGSPTVQKFSSSTEDFQNPMNVIYPFTVYVPGTYNIAEVSGNDINSIYLSNYTIGIDDTMYDLADNITSTADGLTGNMKVYETGLTCDLTPGTHYLTFSITSERQRDGANAGAYAFLDHIDLELEEEPELNLEIADEYVEKGGSTYVTLTSVNPRTGAVVDEVYESVTYSSSDTSVATVGQDRTVTAVGPGKAAIIADVVRQNGEEERVSVDVKVTVNALYCEVEGFTLDGEALTELTGGIHSVGAKVNIENKMLFPVKAAIVFAAYAGNTLKGIEVVSDNAVEGFYITPYELTLDNFDMDGVTQLSVMVWNDISGLQPIAQKTSFAD